MVYRFRAGRIERLALDAAGVERARLVVARTVREFGWQRRGTRLLEAKIVLEPPPPTAGILRRGRIRSVAPPRSQTVMVALRSRSGSSW